MKKKITFFISMILILSLVLASCSKDDIYSDKEKDKTQEQTKQEKKEETTTAKDTEKQKQEETKKEETKQEETKKENKELSLKVVMPYGTPTLSMVKMITENPSLGDGVTVDYEKIQATDVLVSMLINSEPDIAMVPTNLAATIFNKGIDYKLAASSVWGTLYLVSSEDIKSVEDLKGKKIGSLGRNLTPDVVFRYIVSKNGLNPDEDMEIEYFAGAPETAANFIAGKTNTALIPQPVLTKVLMKRKDAKVVLNIQDEWNKVTGTGSFPQASIIVKSDLYKNSPEVVDNFLRQYKAGIDWLNENPLEAGKYYEALNIGLKAKMLEKAIPACNIKYVQVAEEKEVLENYLNILFEYNPKLLGGKKFDKGMMLEK